MTLHDLIADKLERADAATRAALLRIPLDNIDRWIANGHTAPHRLNSGGRLFCARRSHRKTSPNCGEIAERERQSRHSWDGLRDHGQQDRGNGDHAITMPSTRRHEPGALVKAKAVSKLFAQVNFTCPHPLPRDATDKSPSHSSRGE